LRLAIVAQPFPSLSALKCFQLWNALKANVSHAHAASAPAFAASCMLC
jgi:hypothetical protein